MQDLDPLYQIKVTCDYCDASFQSSRVRPRFKQVSRVDTDYCNYYKEHNPDFYVVRICPYCGYASTENFTPLLPAYKALFREKIAAQWQYKDYGGERTYDDAMYLYKMALVCGQLKKENSRVMAGILHHIAWLYRYAEDSEQEKRFLQFALDEYTRFFEAERSDDENSERLMYLMGELNRRLKNYNQAVKWFARVANNRYPRNIGVARACREQWAVTREDMLADQAELEASAEEQ